MRLSLITLFAVTFFLLPFLLQAQQFGGNPPSVKWEQINTPVTRIIFPAGIDSQSRRVANVISYLAGATQNTIGSRQRKINLVLQNQTTISNAYVGLGPFRSEFFLTPFQNSFELGSLPWIDQLAIHEFRHIQQYNNFNVGLSKVLRILFGEEGQAFGNNLAIPNWFFEGDAVFNETNVSLQGRGRLPWFYKPYRSLWQADKNYSWMKLRNGSYKDFVPDHYALGYLLIAYGREKFGDDFWKNVAHDAAAFKGLLYPFQQAIKKYSGKNFSEFRNDAFNFYKNSFFVEETRRDATAGKKTYYTSSEYPAYTNNKAIVFVRSSYMKIPAFYLVDEKGESKIRTKDVSLDNYFSCRNGKIVYASYRPDKRWTYRDYSELQILDIRTGKQHTFTKRSKYFSPDISENGKQIVAVEVSPQGRSSLQILNTQDGKIISSLPNPYNLFYTYPKFYKAGEIISAVRNQKGQMTLARINIRTGDTEFLLPFSFNVFGFPCIWQDTVYFSASHGNNDQLFAFSLVSKQTLLLQSPLSKEALGYYQPAVNAAHITWTTFTANGFTLVEKQKDSLTWQGVDKTYFEHNLSEFGITALHKSAANLLETVPSFPLPPTKYDKATRLLYFHSIEPGVDDPLYSVTLVSENILNTLQSQLSFAYNRGERYKKIGFNAVYSALFPWLSAGLDYTLDRRGRYHGQRVFWNEAEPGAGLTIPLNLSKGRYLTQVNTGTRYTFNQTTYQGAFKDTFGSISYSYLNNFISFTNQVQKSRQQIFPAFAQTLLLNFKKAITKYEGWQWVANANLYFPGLLPAHSVVLNGAWLQKDKSGQLNFSGNFPFSRGYTSENLHQMFKYGINYHFPLLYPDAGFASIIYLLRARANLFYDQTQVKDFFADGSVFKTNFSSGGTEIYFDTKWWNVLPITFGVRYTRLLDPDIFGASGRNRWEVILPVNLLQQ